MRDIQSNLIDDIEDIESEYEIELNSISVSNKENAVLLGVSELNEDLDKELNEEFGENAIDLVVEDNITDDSRTAATSNMQGGLVIASTSAGSITPEGYCSIGFTGTLSGSSYAVTAGHCGASSYYQGGNLIGSMSSSNVYNDSGSDLDVGLINLNSNANTTSLVYTNSSTGYHLSGVTSAILEGDPVTLSGAATGISSGEITDNRAFYNPTNGNSGYRVAADYNSTGGDSGGTIYSNNELYGVHGGSSDTTSYFTHITDITAATGISPTTQ